MSSCMKISDDEYGFNSPLGKTRRGVNGIRDPTET